MIYSKTRMMKNHINILLYSKFSTASRKFVELVENNNISDFNLLCIDNKKIRERILKSEKLNIKEVPCIIRLNQNTGLAESYEGDRAFQLLRNYIEMTNQQMEHPLVQPPMKHNVVQHPVTQHPVTQPVVSPILPSDVDPMVPPMTQQVSQITKNIPRKVQQEESMNVSMLPPENPPKQDSIQKQQKLINATTIEELGSDINKGQTMNTYMHVPKSVEFDIDIENRQRTVKTDRSVKSNESGNIVNRAMQMQKEREQESSMPGQRPIS